MSRGWSHLHHTYRVQTCWTDQHRAKNGGRTYIDRDRWRNLGAHVEMIAMTIMDMIAVNCSRGGGGGGEDGWWWVVVVGDR